MLAVSILLAVVLDKLLGEPKRYHPLIYFGQWANCIEKRLNRDPSHPYGKVFGVVATLLVISPILLSFIALDYGLSGFEKWHTLLGGVVLYIAIGWQSLMSHAQAIAKPLQEAQIQAQTGADREKLLQDNLVQSSFLQDDLVQGDLVQDKPTQNKLIAARSALAMIVSRDTSDLDETAIAKATTESVLENGADAIFSAIFWFCLLGVPGVVLYRMMNTLDAMWGYKTARFKTFGWCAARYDDALNFIPARLTAITYAFVGNFGQAIRCWQQQGLNWKSPNAGPVMASGAGALGVSLGGGALYHGKWQDRPILGLTPNAQNNPTAQTITLACSLVSKSLLLWVVLILLTSIMMPFLIKQSGGML